MELRKIQIQNKYAKIEIKSNCAAQGDQMHWCKTASILPKKAQINKHRLPKMRYRPSKKAPVSSIQAKKSATDLQK